MSTTHLQACPLCGTDAQFEFHDHNNRKHYRCSVCKEYVITVLAEQKVLTASTQWQKSTSESAKKAPEGKILVITVPLGDSQKGMASPPLKSEFLARSEQIR